MGSAGRKGCGFRGARVTEREDCLAVWKHSSVRNTQFYSVELLVVELALQNVKTA
jgi:hypothetical protein